VDRIAIFVRKSQHHRRRVPSRCPGSQQLEIGQLTCKQITRDSRAVRQRHKQCNYSRRGEVIFEVPIPL